MAVDLLIISATWTALRIDEIHRFGRSQTPGRGHLYPYNPNRVTHLARSLGPEKIAWRVRQAGYTSRVLYFAHFYTHDQFKQLIAKFVGPKTIVAVSSVFVNDVPGIKSIVDVMKHYIPKENKTLIGGQSAATWSNFALQNYNYKFDFVINGFAENDIVHFMNKHLNNGIQKKIVPHWEITSCDFRWSEDALIFPTEALPLETARGCIFECKFCRYNMLGKKKGTYTRDVGLIKEELLYNYEKFGVTDYVIVDDTFNDTPEKVEAWAEMVSTLPFKIRYAAYLRVDLLHRYPHTIDLLKQSGLKATHFGIETIHPEASKIIGKGWSGKHAETFVPYIRDVLWNKEVLVHISLIAGFPRESIEHWEYTRQWVVKNKITCYYRALDIQLKRRVVIGETNVKMGTSIFDREAEHYGYKLIEQPGVIDSWEIGDIKKADADVFVEKCNYEFEQFSQIPPFNAFEVTALGVPFEEILSRSRFDVYSDRSLYKKAEQMVDQYVKKLLSC